MTGLDIDLEMLEKAGSSIDELNIGDWKKPKNEYKGYKDAVVYAVQKDREAREQRIEDSRAKLYARMSPQQRALLEAVANQAAGGGVLDLKQGVDAHLEGLADTWAKHAGALLDAEPAGVEREIPMSEFFNVPVGDIQATERDEATIIMERTGDSHDWAQLPHKMLQKDHVLSDIDEEHRLAYCSAHGYRVRINIRDRRNGQPRWRCEEQNLYRQQTHRPSSKHGGTYASDEPSAPKCCGDGGTCSNCPFNTDNNI